VFEEHAVVKRHPFAGFDFGADRGQIIHHELARWHGALLLRHILAARSWFSTNACSGLPRNLPVMILLAASHPRNNREEQGSATVAISLSEDIKTVEDLVNDPRAPEASATQRPARRHRSRRQAGGRGAQ